MNWRKSSYSRANLDCVEVGNLNGIVVQDTVQADDPQRTVLRFGHDTWARFVRRLGA